MSTVALLREENRDLAERLGTANLKSSQLTEQNRLLNGRLVAVEELLAQQRGELHAIKKSNAKLLQEKCDLAERLAKGKDLVGALVATVPELAFLPNAGQSTGSTLLSDTGQNQGAAVSGHPSTGSENDAGHATTASSGAPPHSLDPAAEAPTASRAEQAAVPMAPARKSLPIGLLFPDGDDRYTRKLAREEDNPHLKLMLERAEAILGCKLNLCPETRDLTMYVGDLVMYVAGLAWLEKLRNEREEVVTCAQAMAGCGVGEYTALVAAGVLSFEDGLKLVRLRWSAMIEGGEASRQQSATVFGLEKSKLAALCALAAKQEGSGATCQISRELHALGFWVGGTEKSVLVLKELAEKAGALHVQVLWFPCAVHTSLMKAGGDRMSAALDEMLPRMRPPRTPVYMNAIAAPVRPSANPSDIAKILKKELICPLLWERSIKAMIEEGVAKFYEVGPGQSLKDLMRHVNVKLWRTMTSL